MCSEKTDDWDEIENETLEERLDRYLVAMGHLRDALEAALEALIAHEKMLAKHEELLDKLTERKSSGDAPKRMYG